MNTINKRIKLLEQQIASLTPKGDLKKLLVPRRLKSRKEQQIRILNKQIQKYIENGSIGDLNLSDSPIVNIPKELIEVGGDLDLCNCKSLKSLPDGLRVDGALTLRQCTIEVLPKNLHVRGDLDLYNASSLKSLPDNLHVGDMLELSFCESLKSLSKNLYVGGSLYLGYIPFFEKYYNTRELIEEYLKSINATVEGNIYLKDKILREY